MTKPNVLSLIVDFINQDEGKPFELLKDVSQSQNNEFLTKSSIILPTNRHNKKVFISDGETPNEPYYIITDHYLLATGYEVFYLERGDY